MSWTNEYTAHPSPNVPAALAFSPTGRKDSPLMKSGSVARFHYSEKNPWGCAVFTALHPETAASWPRLRARELPSQALEIYRARIGGSGRGAGTSLSFSDAAG